MEYQKLNPPQSEDVYSVSSTVTMDATAKPVKKGCLCRVKNRVGKILKKQYTVKQLIIAICLGYVAFQTTLFLGRCLIDLERPIENFVVNKYYDWFQRTSTPSYYYDQIGRTRDYINGNRERYGPYGRTPSYPRYYGYGDDYKRYP